MPTISRRSILAVTTIVLSVLACPPAGAQEFPSKQMRLIVPFAAGGAADIIGRTIADKLGALYGKTVIVENMAGAGSNIGINATVKAEPDGHTLVLGSIAVAVNPFLYKQMPFDPAKDLAPLTLALETPNIVIVPATSNVQTLADLIAKAKAAPLNYASAGIGSSLHLAAELFKQQAKVDLAHVAYRGSNPALTDLIAGRMDVMFDNASTALPQIEARTVRAIAVTTKARLATLPDVPTVAEAGVSGYEMGNWWAFFTSAKVPSPITARLSADLRKILIDPDVQRKMAQVSGRIIASSADDLAAHLTAETSKWKRVVESASIGAN
ncbi:Bug family tripartite tricarboxylate transporter substrate binding protein [Bradyrhizobium sp.]|uniref:Bug family tripartite tricarboxylate transporter substrate binding protein n=1 Tax=Bradyrhizobium sp. TaxID=376 RepID=UPI0040383350